jgi:predicted nuclease with RNAse H fold
MNFQFTGIDYGAKLAGTTAICFAKNGHLHLAQSAKKQDADAWLRRLVAEQKPSAVFMDAPLSLPGVYFGTGENFHYRQCDQLLGAMSPMFLGGLTARAMQVRAGFLETPFYEIYPAQLVRTLLPDQPFYKNDLPSFLEKLAEKLPLPFAKQPENWHQVDAALAWLTGWRHGQGEALKFGEEIEGLIWV